MREILDDWQGRMSIEEKKISNLRYADHTVVIAKDEEELVEIMTRQKEYGLRVNKVITSHDC